ncbi:MAG: hypothetical protein HC888_15800, partial [Candidatus Competibacteraceae bacterium]|nr:hypothetical protein [Candidatus Competibacteraceae bacterium]
MGVRAEAQETASRWQFVYETPVVRKERLLKGWQAAGYTFIGSTWLVMKTEDALQVKAVAWARRTLLFVVIGMAAISLATPFVSERIFWKWFSFPAIIALAP